MALYTAVPLRYAADERRFSELFNSFRYRRGYMGLIGDSLRSGFGGSSGSYHAQLCNQMIQRYGRVHASTLGMVGGMSTPAVKSLCVDPVLTAGVPARGVTCTYPSPISWYSGETTNAHEVAYKATPNSDGGFLSLLKYNWGVTLAPANVHDTWFAGGRVGSYMDVSTGDIGFRVYIATKAGSATTVRWCFTPDSSDLCVNNRNEKTSGDIVVPELDSADFKVIAVDFTTDGGAWNRGTHPYPQVRIASGDENKTLSVLATRFIDPSSLACGLVVDDFAGPGYLSNTFMDKHGACGEALLKLGPYDLFLIGFGTNDNGNTAVDTYVNNIKAIMTLIRTAYNAAGRDPLFVVASPPNKTSAIGNATVFNSYAEGLYNLAKEDPRVMFINTQLALARIGCHSDNANIATEFLSDGTHLTAHGQRQMALTDASLMFGRPGAPASKYGITWSLSGKDL